MALFGSNKKKEIKAAPVDTSAAPVQGSRVGRDLSHILRHARITEKATMHSADSVYVFDVDTRATKRDIMQAVQSLYKVTPRMVRVVTIPSKSMRSRKTGRTSVKGGGKKAYVYLKSGETITIA